MVNRPWFSWNAALIEVQSILIWVGSSFRLAHFLVGKLEGSFSQHTISELGGE